MRHRLERAAMDRTGSKFMKSGQVEFGAVTLVLVEAIFWKLGAEVTHHPVACDLGDDAGGGDGQTVAIAVDDGRLRKWKRKNGKTVDQNVLRRESELGERDPHRFMRRAQNIDPIDLEMIDHTDGPGDLGVRNQLVVNFFAAFWSKLLGIV